MSKVKKPSLCTTDLFAPQDLTELNKCIKACSSCSLSGSCLDTSSAGSLRSGIVFVGEALGAKEVELKRAFSGPAGKECDKRLLKAGLFRPDVYTTNVVRARPLADGKNRTPKSSEINACLPHLLNEIAIIEPRVIVCLGGVAANALLNPHGGTIPVGKLRGTLNRVGGRVIVATFHPSYVIRSRRMGNTGPGEDVVADLKTAKRAAEEGRWLITSPGGSMCPWKKPGFMGSCSPAHAAYLKAEEGYIERAVHKGTKVILDGNELVRNTAIIQNPDGPEFYILTRTL